MNWRLVADVATLVLFTLAVVGILVALAVA